MPWSRAVLEVALTGTPPLATCKPPLGEALAPQGCPPPCNLAHTPFLSSGATWRRSLLLRWQPFFHIPRRSFIPVFGLSHPLTLRVMLRNKPNWRLEGPRCCAAGPVAPVSIRNHRNCMSSGAELESATICCLSIPISVVYWSYCQAVVPNLCLESKRRVALFIHSRLHAGRFGPSLQLLGIPRAWLSQGHHSVLGVPASLMGALG